MVLVRWDREEAAETRHCQEPEAGRFTEAAEKGDMLRLWNQTSGFIPAYAIREASVPQFCHLHSGNCYNAHPTGLL